jgi:hypothetical protein
MVKDYEDEPHPCEGCPEHAINSLCGECLLDAAEDDFRADSEAWEDGPPY